MCEQNVSWDLSAILYIYISHSYCFWTFVLLPAKMAENFVELSTFPNEGDAIQTLISDKNVTIKYRDDTKTGQTITCYCRNKKLYGCKYQLKLKVGILKYIL